MGFLGYPSLLLQEIQLLKVIGFENIFGERKNLRLLDGDLGSVMKSGEPPEFDRLPFVLEACGFSENLVSYNKL